MTVKKKIDHQHKKPVVEVVKATVQVKDKKVDVYTKAYNDTIKRAGSVYTASYTLIDETIDDIKKMSRKVSTGDYSANNVYLILQDALKKVRLAEN
jgi:hypothetical protein|tara:strand:+ start:134 stop:421 length:288 start_codon:yes stop_codon:yes gene_type:complete